MYFKKFLNQPNLVGTVMIALLFGAGFVYAFAFDGFNVETATGGEVETWLEQANGGGSGGDNCSCEYANCPGSGCSNCTESGDGCDIVCKVCGCPSLCSNFKSFSCKLQANPPKCLKNAP